MKLAILPKYRGVRFLQILFKPSVRPKGFSEFRAEIGGKDRGNGRHLKTEFISKDFFQGRDGVDVVWGRYFGH